MDSQSAALPLASEKGRAFVGLAVLSHDDTILARARFKDITFNAAPPSPQFPQP